MEPESGNLQPGTKKRLEPSEAERGKEGFSL